MNILQAIESLASAFSSKQQEAITHYMAYFQKKKPLHHSQSPLIAGLKQAQIQKALHILSDVFYSRSSRQQAQHLLDTTYFIIKCYSEAHKKATCNDMALLYMNMEAYFQLNFNQNPELARQSLEDSINYNRDKVQCDPVLMGITVNNLSSLNLKLGEYDLAFKTFGDLCTQDLLIQFKKTKIEGNPRLKEQILVLINTYYLVVCSMKKCAKAYGAEMNDTLKKHYVEYTDNFMSKGHRLCLEHLGKKSIFAQYFRKLGSKDPEENKSFKLPLVVKVPRDDKMLEGDVLKKQLEEAVKKCIEPKLEQIQNLLIHKTPQKQTPNAALLYETICKHDNNFMFISKLFESIRGRFGKVKLSLEKNSMTIHRAQIDEQTVFSLEKQHVTVMNAPFSLQYQTCTPFEFLKYFIVPYVKIQSNKLEFTLQMKSLADQLKINFLDQPSGVIVTHIHSSIFRICINTQKSGIFYVILQVGPYQNSEDVINEEIDVEHVDPTSAISTKPEGEDIQKMKLFVQGVLNEKPAGKKGLIGTKRLVDRDLFQKVVGEAVSQLDQFIKKSFLEKYDKKLLSNTDIFLFKYMVKKFGQKQSTMHCIRRQQSAYLQITVENTYETFGLDGKIIAKGFGIYNLSEMESDFGVKFEALTKKIQRLELYQVVLKMFTLKTYLAELTAEQRTLFKINSVIQIPLLGRTFKRTYSPKRYFIPITACLVSIAGDQPVGVKITAYSIDQNIQRGVFLTIDATKWFKKKKPQSAPKVSLQQFKKLSRHKYTSQYSMISDYHLADTLIKGGFQLLIEQFVEYPDQENVYAIKAESALLKWSRLQVALTFDKFKKKLDRPF